MLSFLTVAGFIVGIVLFLNLINARDPKSLKGKNTNFDPNNPPRLNARKILQMQPGETRPRICPVCGTLLDQTDFLYAALEPENGQNKKRQAHIYGCRFCYATDGVNLNQKELSHIEP